VEDDPKVVRQRADALRLSRGEIDHLVQVIRSYKGQANVDAVNDLAVHRFWREAGVAGIDGCLLALADYLATAASRIDQDDWLRQLEHVRLLLHAYYERYEQVVEPPPFVDGNDLMQSLSLEPGPVIGALIDHLREAQVMGFVQSSQDALRIAKAYIEQQESL
jgi:hypothetical protein